MIAGRCGKGFVVVVVVVVVVVNVFVVFGGRFRVESGC